MRWLLILATLSLVSVLAQADAPLTKSKGATHHPKAYFVRAFLLGKKHQKRGSIPTYSHGYDTPIVKHSILKPLIVKYPVHSVPLSVKIPANPPATTHFKYPVTVGHQQPIPAVQANSQINPTVSKPGWPVTKCPEQPTILRPIAPALIPSTTVQIAPTFIPAPPLVPLLPLPQAPLPFITKPIVKPIVPIFHPTPSVIKPGNSLHTSFFATFPRHPFINTATVPITPLTPLHQISHLAPAAPIPPPFALPPPQIPIHISHPPLNLGHIPIQRFPFLQHITPQVPTKFIPTIPPNPFPLHPIGLNPAITLGHHLGVNPAFHLGQPQANTPLGVGELPGSVQLHHHDQGNVDQSNAHFHGIQPFGGDNSWTPMTPTEAHFSHTQAHFPSQDNVNTLFHQVSQDNGTPLFHQGTQDNANPIFHQVGQDGNEINQNDQNQGYYYQQEPEQSFQDGNQQYAGNSQHEPQLHQSFPEQHPTSSIEQEYHNHIPLRQHLPLNDPTESFAGYNKQ